MPEAWHQKRFWLPAQTPINFCKLFYNIIKVLWEHQNDYTKSGRPNAFQKILKVFSLDIVIKSFATEWLISLFLGIIFPLGTYCQTFHIWVTLRVTRGTHKLISHQLGICQKLQIGEVRQMGPIPTSAMPLEVICSPTRCSANWSGCKSQCFRCYWATPSPGSGPSPNSMYLYLHLKAAVIVRQKIFLLVVLNRGWFPVEVAPC